MAKLKYIASVGNKFFITSIRISTGEFCVKAKFLVQ